MARDHYIVLGIPRGASPEQIKTAYRRGAKRLHPDACGDAHPDAFRELTDAYETLSDGKKRKAYDDRLRHEPSSARPIPGQRGAAPGAGPCPVMPLDNAPAFPSPVRMLDIQVRLSPDLARAGGPILLELPLAAPCPRCAGGFRGVFRCPLCGGRGTMETAIAVPLDIAPGTADGDRCTVVLRRHGLRLHIRFGECNP
jgi:molecular chaperone DnaJ